MSTQFAAYTGRRIILRKNLNASFGDAPSLNHREVYTVSFIVKKSDKVLVALSEIKHHTTGQAWCYGLGMFEPFELPTCLTRFLHDDANYLLVAPDKFDIEAMREQLNAGTKGYQSIFSPISNDNRKKSSGTSPS